MKKVIEATVGMMADVLIARVKIKLFGKLQYHFIVPETGWG